MNQHNTINYVEFPATDFATTKQFYSEVFGWTFQDWGDSYMSFSESGIEGGFAAVSENKRISNDGALVVLYSENLEGTMADIKAAGGSIVDEPISFPGGRRFHFHDPNGNFLAVWSDK